jgi:hypothetical protein
MNNREDEPSGPPPSPVVSYADVADRLASLAQYAFDAEGKSLQGEGLPTGSSKYRTMSESIDELVRDGSNLTEYAGIGEAIASAMREVVLTVTGSLKTLKSEGAFPTSIFQRIMRVPPPCLALRSRFRPMLTARANSPSSVTASIKRAAPALKKAPCSIASRGRHCRLFSSDERESGRWQVPLRFQLEGHATYT